MLHMLGPPDKELLKLSHQQLVSCARQPLAHKVVEAKKISCLVAAIPHKINRRGGPGGALVRYGEDIPEDCYVDLRTMIVVKPGGFLVGTDVDVEDEEV